MKILALIRENSGPCLHRIINPLSYMEGVDVRMTNTLRVADFEQCDLFIYNRTVPDAWLEQINLLRQIAGFKICVDIDDFWHLDPHHILYNEYLTNGEAERQTAQLTNADFVTVTHERLADEVKQFQPNVYVLPNAIPKRGQFVIDRTPHHLTRIFWQGTITHEQDVALLQRPMSSLADLAPKIKCVMAGYVEGEEVWHKMTSDYTAGYKHQYAFREALGVDSYYSLYAEADICLVPLINSPFNRCKSNLKVLEAANLGLPCVVSDVHPYKDLPVLYAKGAGDWVKHIRKLVGSRRYRREAGEELAEFCDKHFNFETINLQRRKLLEYQCSLSSVK